MSFRNGEMNLRRLLPWGKNWGFKYFLQWHTCFRYL